MAAAGNAHSHSERSWSVFGAPRKFSGTDQAYTVNEFIDSFQRFVMIFQMIELALCNIISSQNMKLDNGIHLIDHENDFIDH